MLSQAVNKTNKYRITSSENNLTLYEFEKPRLTNPCYKDDSGSDDLKEVAKKFGDRTEYMLVTDKIDQNTGDKLAEKLLKSQGRDFIHD